MERITKITFSYTLIAIFATLINLASQAILIMFYKEKLYAIELSILVGTFSSLPIKYALEKKYIFNFKSKSLKLDGKLFILYSFLGIFTTLLFWCTEYAFQIIYESESMRYLGGTIGLSIGYIVKYQLDRKFVFKKNPNE